MEEKKYSILHQGSFVEMTAKEINALPAKIKALEDELLQTKALNQHASDYMKQNYRQKLLRYYSALSQHFFNIGNSSVKFIGILMTPRYAPAYFVVAEIYFDKDLKISNINLREMSIEESNQIVRHERDYVARFEGMRSLRDKKANKAQYKRIPKMVQENYVTHKEVNSDKCNRLLKNWIAEMF